MSYNILNCCGTDSWICTESVVNKYQRKLNTYYRSLTIEDPPSPWRFITSLAIGGLSEIGYGKDSDLLLVISPSGRGIINCITGERLARDYNELSSGDYDPIRLLAKGIGPLLNEPIRIAGIHGGGLPTMSSDGWRLEVAAPDWPDSFVLLRAPTIFVNNRRAPEDMVKVSPRSGDDAIIANGFSPTGRSFVVAMSHTVEVFRRLTDEV